MKFATPPPDALTDSVYIVMVPCIPYSVDRGVHDDEQTDSMFTTRLKYGNDPPSGARHNKTAVM
jgi:hypothetical protein